MNVLYLTLNPSRRSTNVPTEGWFRFLPERGLRPVLVAREIGPFQQWAISQGVPVYQDDLPYPSRTNPLPFLKSLWNLRKVIRRHRIDLVHCNEHEIYPAPQLAARLMHLPIVVTVHFTMAPEFCRWAFSGSKAPERMFFVSERSMDVCAAGLRGVVPPSRWKVLHNGLDLEAYRPDEHLRRAFRLEHNLGPETCVIGAACAFRRRKQLEHLFEAAARVRHPNVKVLLAGFSVPEEEPYTSALLEAARDRLGDRLCFIGELDDVRGFMNGLDLFVNTSREESFGISVLEALACGTPVVGYASQAIDEVVLPGGGEIIEQDNLDSLVDGIERWIADAGRLRASRLSARRRAEQFDLRTFAGDLWDAYEELLPPSRG